MNNLQVQFLDCNSNPLVTKVLFTPVAPPNITASYLSVGDSYQFTSTSSFPGQITASIVPATYAVTINTPTPASQFFMVATETGSYLYSGSVQPGVAQCVYFNLINLVKFPFSVRKVVITPLRTYPVIFSGSIIPLCASGSITTPTGSVFYDQVIPGVYTVDCFGKIDTQFHISVPQWHNTGSNGPCWNAKDLIIVKPSKGIPVKLNNADNSYVLTVSSSDARYFPIDSTLPVAATSSWALNAISSSQTDHSNFADSASWASASLSASWASQSFSASYTLEASHSVYADTASYAQVTQSFVVNTTSASWASSSLSASWAATMSQVQYGPITITDATNVARLYLVGDAGTGGHTSTIVGSPAGLILTAQAGDFVGIGSEMHIGVHDIVSAGGKFVGTSSWASQSLSASVAYTYQSSRIPAYGIDDFGSAELQDLGLGLNANTYLTSDQITTLQIVADGITASLYGNATTATSASWASQSLSASYFKNDKITVDGNGNVTTLTGTVHGNIVSANTLDSSNLLISTDISTTGTLHDQNNSTGSVGQPLVTDAFGVHWSNSITASVQGTSSVALQSISASFATTASWAPTNINITASAVSVVPANDNALYNIVLAESSSATSPSELSIAGGSTSIISVNPSNGNFNVGGSITAASVSSSLFGTASWSTNAVSTISSSTTLQAVSADFATLSQNAVYAGSSSWASASISASYALNATPTVSASWASQSLSASYAPFIQTYQVSGSWASSSISASYAQSASWAPSTGGGTTDILNVQVFS